MAPYGLLLVGVCHGEQRLDRSRRLPHGRADRGYAGHYAASVAVTGTSRVLDRRLTAAVTKAITITTIARLATA